MKYIWYACAALLLWSGRAHAQTVTAYSFLQLPTHARLQALGGNNVSEHGRDVNYAFINPALVNDSLSHSASAGYLFYLAGTGQVTTAYAHTFPRAGTLVFGLRHVNYGTLEGYDNTGMPVGTFRSADTELLVGKVMQSGVFRFAINTKAVLSNLAGYRSTALLTDLGGAFVHPNQRFQAGLAFRNLGAIVSDYTPSSRNTLPFDVQLGATFKPEHMPARFSVTATRLARPGNIFQDPAGGSEPSALKKGLTHLTVGAEILLSRQITVLTGFNALRQYELRNGFSWGVSMHIRHFTLVLSNAAYQPGTGAWALTLSTNTKALWKVKNL